MQIAIHMGAHCTDDERLLKSIMRDADHFREQGVKLPAPMKYRNLLRETLENMGQLSPASGTRETLLEAISDGDSGARRLVLGNPTFICFLKRIFEDQLFYHLIDEKLRGMRSIFAQDELSYFMGIRNPAVFIPMAFGRQEDLDYFGFIRNTEPIHLRWIHVIERMKRADPQAKITIWCHEDAPYIWGRLIREVAGLAPSTRVSGGYDMLQSLLTEEGMAAFVTHLRANPPQSEQEKHEAMGDYIRQYPGRAALPLQIDLPGWDQALIDQISAQYYADVDKIASLPGVTFLRP